MTKTAQLSITLTVLLSALLNACSHTAQVPAEAPEPYLSTRASPVDVGRYLGPQPTRNELATLGIEGVTTVINFRRPEEMAKLDFDEHEILTRQSINYVQIPVGRGQYSPAKLSQLKDALNDRQGKILLHCGSGWRASELMVAHLVENEGWDLNEALQHAIGWWPLALEQVTKKSYRLDTATP